VVFLTKSARALLRVGLDPRLAVAAFRVGAYRGAARATSVLKDLGGDAEVLLSQDLIKRADGTGLRARRVT
jgi:hypothetical protein